MWRDNTTIEEKVAADRAVIVFLESLFGYSLETYREGVRLVSKRKVGADSQLGPQLVYPYRQ